MKYHRHLGIQEIAAALGVSRQRVYQLLTEDPTFPEPVDELVAGKIWHEADVASWIEGRIAIRRGQDETA